MAKEEKKTIVVNEKEYNVDDLTENQVAMVNHIQDLDRKLNSARFNLEQLEFGRLSFVNALADSLENEVTDVAAE